MSISNLFEDNEYKLKSKSLTVTGDITCKDLVTADITGSRTLTLVPSVDANGGLVGNQHLSFASNDGTSGIPYVTSSATSGEIRIGDNSAGAGIKLFAGSNTGSINVMGNVTANNIALGSNAVEPSHLPVAGGTASWSGGGSSLAVSAPGVLSTDLVMVTPLGPSDQPGAVLSHAIPTANTVTIHLKANDTTNTSSHHYVVYRSLE